MAQEYIHLAALGGKVRLQAFIHWAGWGQLQFSCSPLELFPFNNLNFLFSSSLPDLFASSHFS